MTEQKKTRREKLEEMLAKSPNDAFTLYGLALECKMYAQSLAQNERSEDARAVLNQGIQAAQRAGNHHALSEMEGLLSELS